MSGDRSTGPEIERSEPGSALQCPVLEPPPPRAERWLFGPLFGGFLTALVLLGISHAVAFFVWAAASAATVLITLRHARQSGLPALPSAVMVSRRRGER